MLIKTLLCLDAEDSPLYEGWHDPAEHWNGWAVPYFEREQLDKVVADNSDCLRWGKDGLEWFDDVSIEIIHPEMIEGMLLWPMQIGWVWITDKQ